MLSLIRIKYHQDVLSRQDLGAITHTHTHTDSDIKTCSWLAAMPVGPANEKRLSYTPL